MTGKRTFSVMFGTEEVGVVIQTYRGFEAHHHVDGYLETYPRKEAAIAAVQFRCAGEMAA
jgi:hypothetical protein